MILRFGSKTLLLSVGCIILLFGLPVSRIRSVQLTTNMLGKIDKNVEFEERGLFQYPIVNAIEIEGDENLQEWLRLRHAVVHVKRAYYRSCKFDESTLDLIHADLGLAFVNCEFTISSRHKDGFSTKNSLSFFECYPSNSVDLLLHNSRTRMLTLKPKHEEVNRFFWRSGQYAMLFTTEENLLSNRLPKGTEYWLFRDKKIENQLPYTLSTER